MTETPADEDRTPENPADEAAEAPVAGEAKAAPAAEEATEAPAAEGTQEAAAAVLNFEGRHCRHLAVQPGCGIPCLPERCRRQAESSQQPHIVRPDMVPSDHQRERHLCAHDSSPNRALLAWDGSP